jgi:hypothetical protein
MIILDATVGPNFMELPIVLAPGSAIGVGGLTDNQAIGAMFLWRERRAASFELP